MNLSEAKNRLGIYELWEMLGLPGEPGSSCLSPFRREEHASFSVSADGLRFYDFAEGRGGDAIDFLARATGVLKAAACRRFLELASSSALDLRTVNLNDRVLNHSRVHPPNARSEKSLARICNLPASFVDFDTPYRRGYRDRLAKLRNVRPEAVDLACQRGLLAFCHEKVPGYSMVTEWVPESLEPAWVITDNTRYNAQLRFLDGNRWDHLRGQPKAKTWPGSSARWPVGVTEAIPFPLIVLVEGGPDLLAAFHFAQLAGLEDKTGVVAMLGAGMSVHDEALPLFAGKKVRIIPDADAPGQMAADRWAAQLNAVGAEVDTVKLAGLRTAAGTLVKDLNDCCLIHPDDAAQLEGLFE